MKERVNKLMAKLAKEKTEIDLAFIIIQAQMAFLDEEGYFDEKKEEGEEWVKRTLNEYKEAKCKGCCEQEV